MKKMKKKKFKIMYIFELFKLENFVVDMKNKWFKNVIEENLLWFLIINKKIYVYSLGDESILRY